MIEPLHCLVERLCPCELLLGIFELSFVRESMLNATVEADLKWLAGPGKQFFGSVAPLGWEDAVMLSKGCAISIHCIKKGIAYQLQRCSMVR